LLVGADEMQKTRSGTNMSPIQRNAERQTGEIFRKYMVAKELSIKGGKRQTNCLVVFCNALQNLISLTRDKPMYHVEVGIITLLSRWCAVLLC
jgi:hypothetical protein